MGKEKMGSFTDTRDNKTYKTEQMPDGKIWLAENLDFAGNGGIYYNNAQSAPFTKAGRLYTWKQAMSAVPPEWHLPTKNEWDVLIVEVNKKTKNSSTEGESLKATSVWKKGSQGNDKFDFTALPGGTRNSGKQTFKGKGSHGIWWSATDTNSKKAYSLYMHYADIAIGEISDKNRLCSVRCVKDEE